MFISIWVGVQQTSQEKSPLGKKEPSPLHKFLSFFLFKLKLKVKSGVPFSPYPTLKARDTPRGLTDGLD